MPCSLVLPGSPAPAPAPLQALSEIRKGLNAALPSRVSHLGEKHRPQTFRVRASSGTPESGNPTWHSISPVNETNRNCPRHSAHTDGCPRRPPRRAGPSSPLRAASTPASADRGGTQRPHPPALGLGVPLGHTREPWAVPGSRQVGGRGQTLPSLRGMPGGEPVMPGCPRLQSAVHLPPRPQWLLCPPQMTSLCPTALRKSSLNQIRL